jgi:hypothetical protein
MSVIEDIIDMSVTQDKAEDQGVSQEELKETYKSFLNSLSIEYQVVGLK